ncbi:MAG: hypothetical protein ACOYOQ_00280 [Microthrixaceae bacterium]
MPEFSFPDFAAECGQFVQTNFTDGHTIDVGVAWDLVLRDEVPTLERQLREDIEYDLGRRLTPVEEAALAFGMSEGPWWVPMLAAVRWLDKAGDQ